MKSGVREIRSGGDKTTQHSMPIKSWALPAVGGVTHGLAMRRVAAFQAAPLSLWYQFVYSTFDPGESEPNDLLVGPAFPEPTTQNRFHGQATNRFITNARPFCTTSTSTFYSFDPDFELNKFHVSFSKALVSTAPLSGRRPSYTGRRFSTHRVADNQYGIHRTRKEGAGGRREDEEQCGLVFTWDWRGRRGRRDGRTDLEDLRCRESRVITRWQGCATGGRHRERQHATTAGDRAKVLWTMFR